MLLCLERDTLQLVNIRMGTNPRCCQQFQLVDNLCQSALVVKSAILVEIWVDALIGHDTAFSPAALCDLSMDGREPASSQRNVHGPFLTPVVDRELQDDASITP